MNLPSPSLWTAFEDGRRFNQGGRLIELACRDAGAIVLPSGAIVACDPQCDLAQPPLKLRVAPGAYPIFLALTDGHVAVVMVRFRDGAPQRWVPSKPARFSVDSGTGCLMDAKTARMLTRRLNEGKWDRYSKRIDDALAENDGWANVCLNQASRANIVVFRTYGGDGTFATFFGYSETGELICSVTDMFLEYGAKEVDA